MCDMKILELTNEVQDDFKEWVDLRFHSGIITAYVRYKTSYQQTIDAVLCGHIWFEYRPKGFLCNRGKFQSVYSSEYVSAEYRYLLHPLNF